MKTKRKEKYYYVAVDLQSMEAEIFTTITKASEYLNISSSTLTRHLKMDWRVIKKDKYMVCRTTITKSNNKGNTNNIQQYMIKPKY